MPGHQKALNQRTLKGIRSSSSKSIQANLEMLKLAKDDLQKKFKYKQETEWAKDKQVEALTEKDTAVDALKAAENAANVVSEKRAGVIDALCDKVSDWASRPDITTDQMIARLYERVDEFKKGENQCQQDALAAFKDSLKTSGLTDAEQDNFAKSYEQKLEEQAKANSKAFSEMIETLHRAKNEQLLKARMYNKLSSREKSNLKKKVKAELGGALSISSGGLDVLGGATMKELIGRQRISGVTLQPDGSAQSEKWISTRNLNRLIKAVATSDANLYLQDPSKNLPDKVFAQSEAKDPKAARSQAVKNAQKYCRQLLKLGVPEDKLPKITISVNGREEELSPQELKQMREDRGYFKGAVERWRGDWGKLEHAAKEGGGALGFSAEDISRMVRESQSENIGNQAEMRNELSAMRLGGEELQATIQPGRTN